MKSLNEYLSDVERFRARRRELLTQQDDVSGKHLSLNETTTRIDEWLDGLTPEPGSLARRFALPWAGSNDLAETTLGMMSGSARGIAPVEVVRALAFVVGRSRLREALVADAKAYITAQGGGLSAVDRTAALEEIDAELLELEVAEERAIRAAEEAGYEGLDRREDAAPEVVLARDPSTLLEKAAA